MRLEMRLPTAAGPQGAHKAPTRMVETQPGHCGLESIMRIPVRCGSVPITGVSIVRRQCGTHHFPVL